MYWYKDVTYFHVNIHFMYIDPFKVHFEKDIGEEAADKLGQKGNWTTSSVKVSRHDRQKFKGAALSVLACY